MARYDDECRGGFQTRPLAGAPRTGATPAGTFKRFLGACLLLALCGCSPEYFVRAAYEEGRILWRRKPITTVLAEDGVAPDVRRKLEMVLELRDFAADELRLNVGGSYAAYSYIDRPVLLHVLTAVPKTSFEPYTWWFPFVGRVPYKGYFDRSDANKEADALAAQGHDTSIRPAGAFSTLGWFDDPLLGRLLKLDRVRLADVVLHELLHNTLFVPGSVAFNESLANFVGKRGAIEFFVRRHGSQSPEATAARRAWREELEFSELMMPLVKCLRELYREPSARGREASPSGAGVRPKPAGVGQDAGGQPGSPLRLLQPEETGQRRDPAEPALRHRTGTVRGTPPAGRRAPDRDHRDHPHCRARRRRPVRRAARVGRRRDPCKRPDL